MRHNAGLILCVIVLAACAPRSFASEWGCEVLLCAASSAPPWQNIESCHPPMTRLITAMKKPGFSWPTCPEGGTGKPGFEPYAECPPGWSPAVGPDGDGSSLEQSRCTRHTTCQDGPLRPGPLNDAVRHGESGSNQGFPDRETCSRIEYQDRPRRPDPYFFDMSDDTTGKTQRHWFSLSIR